MPEARRIDTDPPQPVLAKDIPAHRDKWPKGSLRCKYCDALVNSVYPTPREKSKAPAPHFRRTGLRGGTNQHSKTCEYNVEERIRVIVDESKGALVRDRTGRRRRPRYRLVLPESFGESEKTGGDGAGLTVAVEMTSILNTAAKIAVLLEDYAARSVDIDIDWIVECRGQRIEWLNFLYTPQRIWVLRRRLLSAAALQHPVAVIFRATRAMSRPRASYTYRSAVYHLVPEPEEELTDLLFVDGRPELVDQAFQAGLNKFYIGYGMWERVQYSRKPAKDSRPPRLTLHLTNTALVAPLSDEIVEVSQARWRNLRL
ncbi:Uncharacterised protein [Mycobacteroides abscessus subsp. abscessus]|nr:Uncharacterised protein [Mycobacteroides abscessus subsp. abscessus]SHX59463.1 Uncharacterised protein [Mycobacteroides abscessus subsp. abscessus]SIC05443.1 Uncharacterised protein [Mycobacteroides abscessus subsp. abscessus]SKV96681.1 Uncharacterised protein [Mycobacteroides abscessus subsp. abscessus]